MLPCPMAAGWTLAAGVALANPPAFATAGHGTAGAHPWIATPVTASSPRTASDNTSQLPVAIFPENFPCPLRDIAKTLAKR